MNAAFVADASVALSWAVASQSSSATDRLLGQVADGCRIFVPSLWPFEVANSLVVLRRRNKILPDDYLTARALITRLRASVDEEGSGVALTRVADLALEYELSVYDAAYLELAIRKQLALASRDGSLNRAAARCGVALLL